MTEHHFVAALADLVPTWRVGAVMWAMVNVLVAQAAAPDDLLSWGLTLAGVTIPFGVGWAWNRQWADAVRRQNDFLREQDNLLRKELIDERAEKLLAHEDADKVRRQMGEVEVSLYRAKAERDDLQRRLGHLEEVVRLRRSETPARPRGERSERREPGERGERGDRRQGGDRRHQDLISEPVITEARDELP